MIAIRARLIAGGAWGRRLMGAGLLAIGLALILGLDHRLETLLLAASPETLTALTARY